jgi:glycosyltransferase involved in cell wall biosynthesis
VKLLHVVPHIDQEASGPAYMIPRLCESLAALGNSVELSCLAARGEIPGVSLDIHPQWAVIQRFAISTSLARSLQAKARQVDIVHNHSLWSMVNVASGLVVPGRGAKLVTTPHGTLSPWALSRSNYLKRALWPIQSRALSRADLLHATSDAEYVAIRSLGFTAPVAVIPNGIDLPALPGLRPSKAKTSRTLLFLSRIHPTKGLDLLLRAWQALEHTHPDWQLVIAGQGEAAHVIEIEKLAWALQLGRVVFPGPLFGTIKSDAYFDADLFVLPTHSENFGMVVAEALAHACPVVVSKGAPWAEVVTNGCGWWIQNDVEALTEALDGAMSLPRLELQSMGRAGREWMGRDFGWPTVASRMNAAYEWILNGGVEPSWVLVD